MTCTELIAKVREYALANYEQGWDVVVETYEDDEIAKVIGKVRTVQGAVDRMAKAIEPYNERRSEVQAMADHDPMVEEAIAFAEELSTRPAMPLAAAEELYQEYSRHPRPTEAGVVCGNCTHRDHNNERVIVRHENAADVRECYAARYDEEQQIEAEIEAEKRVERFFEEGF